MCASLKGSRQSKQTELAENRLHHFLKMCPHKCIYSPFRKYSEPLTFTTFVTLQPYSKTDLILFSLSLIYTQYPIMTKWKQVFRNVCKCYSVPCWSTLIVEAHWGSDYSLKPSWVRCYTLGTPVFGEFLPFFSADPLKLWQVGWGALLHGYFQASQEMFDRVQVRALVGHSRTFRDLSRSHSCIVLTVCTSLRSWVLYSRFSSRISL